MAISDPHFWETLLTSVVSGGSAAASAFVAFFRDVKKRTEDVEKKVGSVESKMGLAYSVLQLEEALKKVQPVLDDVLRRVQNLEGWSGVRQRPSSSEESYDEVMQLVTRLTSRVSSLEEDFLRLQKKTYSVVMDEDFEAADRQRADEINRLRSTMSEIHGLLRGIQSVLGVSR